MASHTHITLLGKTNVGKSTLINALCGQQIAIVSEIAGTTTDPVRKSVEITGVGACTLVDTAGIDDASPLGRQRVEKVYEELRRTDLVLYLLLEGEHPSAEWVQQIQEHGLPCIVVVNKCDVPGSPRCRISADFPVVRVSARSGQGLSELRQQIRLTLGDRPSGDAKSITGNLVTMGDTVLLVMPQDSAAPTGRLILPQVQTIRELLDKGCIVTSCTLETLSQALAVHIFPPHLVITDSRVFREVAPLVPSESLLTSFSVLFAAYKGDASYFRKGAELLSTLSETAHILIAEACTHTPTNEDIGRIRLPQMLRSYIGETIRLSHSSGNDFPDDLTPYDLVIHCGACMFTDTIVHRRLALAKKQAVPMTNYGMAIAQMEGVLEKVVLPQT